MIEIQKLKKRDQYLKKLIGFHDAELVKVITGLRRCGKSSLLKLIQHLQENGIRLEQIVDINFESHDFRGVMSDEVYHYVKEKVVPDKRMYLFFIELQRNNETAPPVRLRLHPRQPPHHHYVGIRSRETYLSNILGVAACRNGITVRYVRIQDLLNGVPVARGEGLT